MDEASMRWYCFGIVLMSLGGCPRGVYRTVSFWAQDNQTLNTQARCIQSAEVVKVAEEQLQLLIRAGHLEAQQAQLRGLGICLIPEPEPCCVMGRCAGPAHGTVTARKVGCTAPGAAWVARSWPPICRPSWPDELHCAPPGTAQSVDWRPRLMDEIGHLVCARLAIPDPADHSGHCAAMAASALAQWRASHQ